MDRIVENHGLSWIAVKIFNKLDDKTLANARLTNSTWKNLIDDTLLETRKYRRERRLVKEEFEKLAIEKLDKIETKFLLDRWPEWVNIFDDFQKHRKLEDVKKFCKMIKKYFESKHWFLDPLMIAAEIDNDISTFELVLPSAKSLMYYKCFPMSLPSKEVPERNFSKELIKLILEKN